MGPIKGFSELQDSIIKMRENFDFMVYGKVQQQKKLGQEDCSLDDACC
jgi:hypothetical protein